MTTPRLRLGLNLPYTDGQMDGATPGWSEIAALARKYGFYARFVLSNTSPYRFHAVLRKRLVVAETKREDQISATPAEMTRSS